MTPDEHTIQETTIEVGDGHTLYMHEWGNPKSEQVFIFLHGGPGGSSKDRSKTVFDAAKHRVVFFDQRGCGKSLPYGSLEHNTTQDLIADITKIADHLEIKQFGLVGGSWGSCLALAYGIAEPDRVSSMVLNGIFTASPPEIKWLDNGLFRIFLPDVWERYLAATPEVHRGDPSKYHFKRIIGKDPEAAKRSAYAYESLEGGVVFLDDRFTAPNFEEYDPAGITIEVQYMANECFMPQNHILDNADRLTMPVWLVQGRYDMVCPPQTAYTLAGKLPRGELIWTTSGHAMERESWNVTRTILAGMCGS